MPRAKFSERVHEAQRRWHRTRRALLHLPEIKGAHHHWAKSCKRQGTFINGGSEVVCCPKRRSNELALTGPLRLNWRVRADRPCSKHERNRVVVCLKALTTGDAVASKRKHCARRTCGPGIPEASADSRELPVKSSHVNRGSDTSGGPAKPPTTPNRHCLSQEQFGTNTQ